MHFKNGSVAKPVATTWYLFLNFTEILDDLISIFKETFKLETTVTLRTHNFAWIILWRFFLTCTINTFQLLTYFLALQPGVGFHYFCNFSPSLSILGYILSSIGVNSQVCWIYIDLTCHLSLGFMIGVQLSGASSHSVFMSITVYTILFLEWYLDFCIFLLILHFCIVGLDLLLGVCAIYVSSLVFFFCRVGVSWTLFVTISQPCITTGLTIVLIGLDRDLDSRKCCL